MKKSGLNLLKLSLLFVLSNYAKEIKAQTGPSVFYQDEPVAYTEQVNAGRYDILVEDTVPTKFEPNSYVKTALHAILAENSILFDYRKYVLTADASHLLDKVAILMIENPTAIFEIHGFADARGDYSDNLSLSEKRAETTRSYLLSKGVHKEQLVHFGFGEQHLINVCDSDSHCEESVHATNRRVEIKLVSVQ